MDDDTKPELPDGFASWLDLAVCAMARYIDQNPRIIFDDRHAAMPDEWVYAAAEELRALRAAAGQADTLNLDYIAGMR